MRAAGYTAVGEFHYVGLAEAKAAIEAAGAAGVELVLLLAAYGRGGIERFRQESPAAYLAQVEELRAEGARVGVAPHSVRACPPDWLREIGRYAEREELVLHVHADEQPREIEDCVAEHGLRPIQLLAETGCLGPRTTIVHGTHANDAELDLLAAAGEAHLRVPDDGGEPRRRFPSQSATSESAGSPLCIGSDSNVRIDPLEELRELEGIARRQELRRNVSVPFELLEIGSSEGAKALGLDEWPGIEIDLSHVSLRGVDREGIEPALVFGCGADVIL